LDDIFKAETYLKKSIEIQEKYMTPNHPTTHVAYYHMGQVLLMKRKPNEAWKYFEKALECSINSTNIPIHTASINAAFGKVQYLKCNYIKALEYYEKALPVFLTYAPHDYNSSQDCVEVIDELKQKINEMKSSKQIPEEKEEFDEVETFMAWGKKCCTKNNSYLAMQYFKKALDLQLENDSTDNETLSYIYRSMGETAQNQREFALALEYYEKMLHCEEKLEPVVLNHLFAAHNRLQIIYALLGNNDLALKHAELSLEMSLKNEPPDYASQITSYANLGCMYKHMENFNTALVYLNIAHNLSQNHEADPDIALPLQRALEYCQKKLQNSSK
jgi:tetratricopeptide (TPR) repeat protein